MKSMTDKTKCANEAYKNLANAIVIQAAEDYKNIFRRLNSMVPSGEEEKKHYSKLLAAEKEVLDFFRSDWCTMLTDVDPEMIIRHIEREAD